MCRSFSIIFAAIAICKKWEKEKKEERREPQTKQRTKNEKPMRSFFLHASAILFSSVLVHLCVVNSTINEWSDSLVVCATSCEVTQRGKFCKHTGWPACFVNTFSLEFARSRAASHPSLAYIVNQALFPRRNEKCSRENEKSTVNRPTVKPRYDELQGTGQYG